MSDTADIYKDTLFPGVAVVTGAASGMGAAISLAFCQSHCPSLAVTDINASLLVTTTNNLNKAYPNTKLFVMAGDISDPKFVTNFYSQIHQKFHRIDYVVNVAGVIGSNQPSHLTTVEDFDKTNAVNYRGVWLCSREAVKYMLEQDPLPSHSQNPNRKGQRGSIVSIASQLGLVSRAGAPIYCASKAAVISLTKSDAIDYARHDIRVNCVCPGVVETPMTTGENLSEEFKEGIKASVNVAPMRRIGLPEEVADAVLFLCSTKASFVTGHAMVVDGGYVIN